MGSQEVLMAVLTEYALGLEIDIAELENTNAILITVIDVVLEQDKHFYNFFYTDK